VELEEELLEELLLEDELEPEELLLDELLLLELDELVLILPTIKPLPKLETQISFGS